MNGWMNGGLGEGIDGVIGEGIEKGVGGRIN